MWGKKKINEKSWYLWIIFFFLPPLLFSRGVKMSDVFDIFNSSLTCFCLFLSVNEIWTTGSSVNKTDWWHNQNTYTCFSDQCLTLITVFSDPQSLWVTFRAINYWFGNSIISSFFCQTLYNYKVHNKWKWTSTAIGHSCDRSAVWVNSGQLSLSGGGGLLWHVQESLDFASWIKKWTQGFNKTRQIEICV